MRVLPAKAWLGPSFLSQPHALLVPTWHGMRVPSHFESPEVSATRSRHKNPSWHTGMPSVADVNRYVVGSLPSSNPTIQAQVSQASVSKIVF